MTDAEWRPARDLPIAVWTFDAPMRVIAAVNGHAMRGGLRAAAGIDFAYDSFPERALRADEGDPRHKAPAAGGHQIFRGRGRAPANATIVLTGKPFSGRDAFEWGILNKSATRCADEEAWRPSTAISRQCARLGAPGQALDYVFGMQRTEHRLRCEVEAYNRLDPHRGTRPGGHRDFNESGRASCLRGGDPHPPGAAQRDPPSPITAGRGYSAMNATSPRAEAGEGGAGASRREGEGPPRDDLLQLDFRRQDLDMAPMVMTARGPGWPRSASHCSRGPGWPLTSTLIQSSRVADREEICSRSAGSRKNGTASSDRSGPGCERRVWPGRSATTKCSTRISRGEGGRTGAMSPAE